MIAKMRLLLKNPLSTIGKGIKGAWEFGASLINEILDVLRQFFDKIRKYTILSDCKQWIDEVLKAVKKELGLGEIAWMSKSFLRLGEDAVTIRNVINLAKRADDGWLNVLCHGKIDAVYIDSRKFKPEAFAKYLKEAGCESGKKIRLISCNTGTKPNGFAQKLANILKVEVEAPNNIISVDEFGQFVIGEKNNGKMKIFKPIN